MILSVLDQGGLFLGSAASGFLLAFIYDIFRTVRRIIPHNKLAVHIEDIIFWIIVLVVMFSFLLNTNNGEIRFFSIAAAFIGMALYVYTLSAFFMKFSLAIYKVIRKMIIMAVSLIFAPFKAVLYLLSFPAGFVVKKIKGVYKYEKKVYNAVRARGRHNTKKLINNIKIVLKKI